VRDRALSGAATALKERERDDRDDEIARLKSKVGEITMDNELLYSKIAAMEGRRAPSRAHQVRQALQRNLACRPARCRRAGRPGQAEWQRHRHQLSRAGAHGKAAAAVQGYRSRTLACGGIWHPHAYSDRTMATLLQDTRAAAQTLGMRLEFVPSSRSRSGRHSA
jgi:hypothetical protein